MCKNIWTCQLVFFGDAFGKPQSNSLSFKCNWDGTMMHDNFFYFDFTKTKKNILTTTYFRKIIKASIKNIYI